MIDKCCVCSGCSTDRRVPISLSLLLGPLYSLRHSNIEIRPINNPPECSSEKKSHVSLTLNQNLGMIKLSEEGTLKARIDQKLGLLHVSQVVNVKESS